MLNQREPALSAICSSIGREWAISDEAGFTSKHQTERVINVIDELFDTWKPRVKYEVINANEYKGKFLNHKIIY